MTDSNLTSLSRIPPFWIVLFLSCLTLLPFLGLADFNTKGEPREAVVALSMLSDGNWILPTNNGGEIPYKPMMFHWLIAIGGLLSGGEVGEYVSRLPSALALIGMTLASYVFFARRKGARFGMLSALVTFTSLELYRSGMNCRVDMVLTAFTVFAIMLLFNWWRRDMKGVPWLAILCMSFATLTKGPVGIVVPCLVAGIFMLVRGVPFLKAFLWLCLWGVMSLVIPFVWYAAAYHQGGKEFLDLVMEENFGRMTNTMSYDSCVHPWPYNVGVLLAGWLPWTIACVLALFAVRWHLPFSTPEHEKGPSLWTVLRRKLRESAPETILSMTVVIVIFVFYCIPQSKRSVYLMPLYPFLGYFIAEMLIWMKRRRPGLVKGFGDFLASLAVLLFITFILIKTGAVPDSACGHGKHAAQNVAMLDALRYASGFRVWFWAAMSPLGAILWWARWRRCTDNSFLPASLTWIVISIYLSLGGAYQPEVLNVKSIKPMALEIEKKFPDMADNLYEFISIAEQAAGDPLHFFELDFYLGDKIRNFRKEQPSEGFLVLSDEDARLYLHRFRAEGYEFKEVYTCPRLLNKKKSSIYEFKRNL